MARASTSLTPVLVSLMLLMLDVSIAVSGNDWEIEDGTESGDSSDILHSRTSAQVLSP